MANKKVGKKNSAAPVWGLAFFKRPNFKRLALLNRLARLQITPSHRDQARKSEDTQLLFQSNRLWREDLFLLGPAIQKIDHVKIALGGEQGPLKTSVRISFLTGECLIRGSDYQKGFWGKRSGVLKLDLNQFPELVFPSDNRTRSNINNLNLQYRMQWQPTEPLPSDDLIAGATRESSTDFNRRIRNQFAFFRLNILHGNPPPQYMACLSWDDWPCATFIPITCDRPTGLEFSWFSRPHAPIEIEVNRQQSKISLFLPGTDEKVYRLVFAGLPFGQTRTFRFEADTPDGMGMSMFAEYVVTPSLGAPLFSEVRFYSPDGRRQLQIHFNKAAQCQWIKEVSGKAEHVFSPGYVSQNFKSSWAPYLRHIADQAHAENHLRFFGSFMESFRSPS